MKWIIGKIILVVLPLGIALTANTPNNTYDIQVPQEVYHPIYEAQINALIKCESGGKNVTKKDSNGVDSVGILQYNNGPKDTLEGGTWEFFQKLSGIPGYPSDPDAAVRMTDWAIGHGFGPRWSCWKILHLSA